MKKKILFIHQEKKFKSGAHYINELIIEKLRKNGYLVETIYPEESLDLFSRSLSGLKNILFFYSLIDRKRKVSRYDLVQGTTYTVLPFLDNGVPVVSHFGSTTYGFLKKVPSTNKLAVEKRELAGIFDGLKTALGINERSASIKSLQDISRIEIEVARKSDAVIAASERVRRELIRNGAAEKKTHLIHNAIEDYWFDAVPDKKVKPRAELVYLGRMGDDVFSLKLKGIDRLIYILKFFPGLKKTAIGMCAKFKAYEKIFSGIQNTRAHLSVEKRKIPQILKKHYGDIYINPGRYEGFCLSLVEAMSQGLVPVTFSIGVAAEIIKNGRNGYLVDSVEEMAKIIGTLAGSPAKRKRMAGEAVKTARFFNADRLTRKLIGLYEKLIKKRLAGRAKIW